MMIPSSPIVEQPGPSLDQAKVLADIILQKLVNAGFNVNVSSSVDDFSSPDKLQDHTVLDEPLLGSPFPDGLIQYFYRVMTTLEKVDNPADVVKIHQLMQNVEKVIATRNLEQYQSRFTITLDPQVFPHTSVSFSWEKDLPMVEIKTQNAQVAQFCNQHNQVLRNLFSANRMRLQITTPVQRTEPTIFTKKRRTYDE